jgi:zinc transporter, ZIP family
MNRHGMELAKYRKRPGEQQPSEDAHPGSGLAIVVGSLIDGIPESIAIGVSLISGGAGSIATVIAIFLSKVPEGLSAATGMKKAGRSARCVLGLHAGTVAISALAAFSGYAVFSRFSAA